MANSWLRLYHDMPNDPKWRTIARASKQTIPVVLGVYVHLLIIASGSVDRGTVGVLNSEDLASALDVDSEAVDAILKAMEGRVLESGKLSGWDKRQTNREDSSTERVKRWRETKVKRNVTQSNAVKPNVTADKKREEEIKKEQIPSRASHEGDSRHVPFREEVEAYAKAKKVIFTWDGSAAKQLALLLKASPELDIPLFQKCLLNRARSSGVTHGEHPRAWLPQILKYQEGPLNEFGKTGEGNGNRNSKTGGNLDSARTVIAAIVQADRNSGAAGEVQPEEVSCGES